MSLSVGIITAQMLQSAHLTDIGAQRKQSTPKSAVDASMRMAHCASQINDRQVLPDSMIANIKANGSATVAGDWCVR
jgi:hypothetical protein